jgi:hypothetical protein
MAPSKRAGASRKSRFPIQSRSKLIKEAIEEAEGCTDRVKQMLCATLPVTVGAFKATRHTFNAKFVSIIGEVLQAEQVRMKKHVETTESSFADLTPAKAQREQAAEQASAEAKEKAEAEKAAKAAVAEAVTALKGFNTALKDAEKARKAGDAELEVVEGKKAQLVSAKQDDLAPLIAGTAGDDTMSKAKVVLEVGKSFDFDASLLSTAEPVLSKALAERGGFDNTCLDQLQGAFTSAIAGLDETLAAGAPAKAERAAVVSAAEAAKTAGEANLADLKEKAQAAKEAEAFFKAAEKSAKDSLAAFMPDLKKAGDALDEAKEDLMDFEEGALQSFTELKDLSEGDFKAESEGWSGSSYYETIDGMKLDRGIIDACRGAVAGSGRVSVDDAKKVFVEVADGGRATACERWTVRYCLQEFKWADAAQTWLIESLATLKGGQGPAKKAKTSGKGYYETVDGFKCDRAIIDSCREALSADGIISKEEAQTVWAKAADGNQVTDAERWTVRYVVSAFNFAEPAQDFIMAKLGGAEIVASKAPPAAEAAAEPTPAEPASEAPAAA